MPGGPPQGGDVRGRRVLVVGLGVAGESVARQLLRRGAEVVVTEDAPGPASRGRADELGLELVERPDAATLTALVDRADLVVPSPPVPWAHPAAERARARGVPLWSEFELAARWSELPFVAITGTDGKTTVTTLVTDMLRASGRRVVDAGNNDLPLVDAIDHDVELVVVEASSFRLQYVESFRPTVGVWLNQGADHLDWHPTVEHYADAKSRIWAAQRDDDLALAAVDDDIVMRYAAHAPARVATFGLADADWAVVDGALTGPDGVQLVAVDELWRALPHDLTNGLAAAAAALAAGATLDGVRSTLRAFRGLPHRVSLVGQHGDVRWYDDSKATAPHAVVAALRGFDSVVLIAGGRNKDLDLSVLAAEAGRIRAVVAIGEAAPEVAAAFEGVRPVRSAGSMDEAVDAAAELARPGDAVLLSPGCASFDWYRGYAERGDDFARAVRERTGATT
jgi:UDP-N-acetylmuramoylalanine--D-glutamate ligase